MFIILSLDIFILKNFLLPFDKLRAGKMCRGRDSNPHGLLRPRGFKPLEYTISPPRQNFEVAAGFAPA